MKVTLTAGAATARPAGMAVLIVFEGGSRLSDEAARFDRASGGTLSRLLRSRDFAGRFLEHALLYPGRGSRAKRVMALGLGPRGDITPPRLLLAASLAARRARSLRAGSVAIGLPAGLDDPAYVQAAAEGAALGQHAFTAYRSKPQPPALGRTDIVVATEARRDASARRRLASAVARGARWAEAACLTRDLASTPGQDLVPDLLAERARRVAASVGAKANVFKGRALERLGMGCLRAVGRGSPHPPCFVVLDRPPADRRARRPETVVLIGKGITFDTGGISLKPREDMHRMKYDMSGAAAVLGVFSALPTIDPPFRVVGLLSCAENMPDGRAVKPGDVLRAMDGTTVEVTNTDAEGRLVLADALCYARRLAPDAIVDVATLTGAIRIALGSLAAGLFTADEPLARTLLEASSASGERLWRMPLWDDYAEELKSDTADLVNSASREGGACIAAAFLKRFAGGQRWAHLDIASTGWSSVDRRDAGRGPTGFGVRLLLEWLSARASARRLKA